MEEQSRRWMRKRFLLLFGRGGACGGGGGGRSIGGAATAATTAHAAGAFRRADRVAAGAGAPDVRVRAGVVLVALAQRVHAAHRAAAGAPCVREDVGGRAR